MTNFFNLTRIELESLLAEKGFPRAHAKTLFRYIYKTLLPSPIKGKRATLPGPPLMDAPSQDWVHPFLELQSSQSPLLGSIPKELSLFLREQVEFPLLEISQHVISGYDRSVKFIFNLSDGKQIETVLMPEKTRITLCVSTQVGCRQACSFCHTGRMGLTRNLETFEIISQLMTSIHWMLTHPEWVASLQPTPTLSVSNLVFMGMGEPLDNTDELIRAIRIMIDPYGLSMAPKRVTVSTAGHLDGLKLLAKEQLGISLALSLHSSDDDKRSRLMPINKRFPIAEVLAYLKNWTEKTQKNIMIQYTLIQGVNDQIEDAHKLIALLQGLKVKINVIPLNAISSSRFEAPSYKHIRDFSDILKNSGFSTTIRFSKGQDIAAACGQLIVKKTH